MDCKGCMTNCILFTLAGTPTAAPLLFQFVHVVMHPIVEGNKCQGKEKAIGTANAFCIVVILYNGFILEQDKKIVGNGYCNPKRFIPKDRTRNCKFNCSTYRHKKDRFFLAAFIRAMRAKIRVTTNLPCWPVSTFPFHLRTGSGNLSAKFYPRFHQCVVA